MEGGGGGRRWPTLDQARRAARHSFKRDRLLCSIFTVMAISSLLKRRYRQGKDRGPQEERRGEETSERGTIKAVGWEPRDRYTEVDTLQSRPILPRYSPAYFTKLNTVAVLPTTKV